MRGKGRSYVLPLLGEKGETSFGNDDIIAGYASPQMYLFFHTACLQHLGPIPGLLKVFHVFTSHLSYI